MSPYILPDLTKPMGNLSKKDFADYAEVIDRALEIHIEKEKIRHGLWKKYEAEAQTRQIKIKADRIEHTLELVAKQGDDVALIKSTIEELLDVINYSVFAVRQLGERLPK